MSTDRLTVRPVVWAFCLAGLVFSIFVNTIPSTFVWDDEQFIYKNTYVTTPGHTRELLTQNIVAGAGLVSNLYRPVQALSHRLDFLMWGSRSIGHHLSNVLFHIAAAVMLYFLFLRIFSAVPAFGAALFFAIHPIQTEAVAYISGRGDILALFFTCAGLLLFIKKNRGLSLLCAALAVFSKESHVLFPVFLALVTWMRREPLRVKEQAPFWGLSAGYTLLRLTVLNFKNTLNFYSSPNILTQEPLTRVWTYCTTFPKGLLLWLWPADLHHERSWSVFASPWVAPVVWGGALFLVLAVAVWFFRKKNIVVAAGIIWFFVATFPTSNLLVLINAIFYDHWFILPGVGLCLVLGAVLTFLQKQNKAVRIAAGLALGFWLAFLAASTVHYNFIWRTPVSLYSYVLEREPRSAKMSTNLGMALADSGQVEESIQYYQRSISISDEYPQTHHNLGMTYLALDRDAEAEKEFRRAVEMEPSFFHSWLNLGALAWNRRDFQAAKEAFHHVLEVNPYSKPAQEALARLEKMSSGG